MSSLPLVLVPGGLYEGMNADQFWVEPGVAAALKELGFDVHPIDRLTTPGSWKEDAEALADSIKAAGLRKAMIIAGSNGCSTAVRLALDFPGLVARLVLCWPATAGDETLDGSCRHLIEPRAGSDVAEGLMAGETIRGVTNAELTGLAIPVTLIPSQPDNRFHQRPTVDALHRLLPQSSVVSGYPESPRPEFATIRAAFITTLVEALS